MIETGDGVPWKGQETDARPAVALATTAATAGRWSATTTTPWDAPHYYSRMAVAPDNENEAYFLTASFAKTIDGGADAHRAARAPRRPAATTTTSGSTRPTPTGMIVAHDQGLSISINRGTTWLRQRLTNAQIYHVTVDNEIPYNVLGNKQDEPTYRGPSNSRLQGGRRRSRHPARDVARGRRRRERLGHARPHRLEHRLVHAPRAPAWSAASSSASTRSRRQFRNVEVWPDQSNGPAEGVKYRFVWDAPLLISPHDHNTIYVGSQHVHRTTNGGQSWEVISPDLTLNDRADDGELGRPDAATTSASSTRASSTASPSRRREQGLIWAGTNDGLLQLTRDGGKTWTNVTKNIPNLPAWGSVRSIVAVALRRGHRVPDRGLPPGEQPRPVRLQDDRLRQDVEADHQRHPEEHAELRADDLRRSGAARPALPRHRERRSTCRSTTARTGSRCRTTCRTRRCPGSPCRSTSTTW